MDNRHRLPQFTSRREMLRTAALGFGSLAFSALQAEQTRGTHHAPKAKRMIFLFMQGGPSQMDLFDFKPQLKEFHGKPLPFKLPSSYQAPGIDATKIMGPISPFTNAGKSGLYMSEWLPELGKVIDDICVLRAVHADAEAHAPAVRQMHTGHPVQVRPSMGSWILYGLGSENQNMPGYITLRQATTGDSGSPANFSSAFLPAAYQGTLVGGSGKDLQIRYADNPAPQALQRKQIDFLQALNREYLERTSADSAMEGMIAAHELAFRMQADAPKLMDLSLESQATRDMYGVGEKETDNVAQQCLLARRLIESGVRFVQVNDGGWDHHGSIRKGLPEKCRNMDKPVAALIRDLKQRGLLEDTLVLWGGEFGRTPFDQDLSLGTAAEETRGREHNPNGFTMWMAGGGVTPGLVYGATDDFAYHAVDGKVHIHDLHATILHLLGIDHERLTYRYAGRDFRLTDIYGRVVKEIVS
ncbi:MAG: DUF1501 domain-containing protein [Bryobacterales bacterium]|nr:DUF1501 domain-containing protein [Bryobacterales bacterium]